jgi:hypothetical protein
MTMRGLLFLAASTALLGGCSPASRGDASAMSPQGASKAVVLTTPVTSAPPTTATTAPNAPPSGATTAASGPGLRVPSTALAPPTTTTALPMSVEVAPPCIELGRDAHVSLRTTAGAAASMIVSFADGSTNEVQWVGQVPPPGVVEWRWTARAEWATGRAELLAAARDTEGRSATSTAQFEVAPLGGC